MSSFQLKRVSVDIKQYLDRDVSAFTLTRAAVSVLAGEVTAKQAAAMLNAKAQ